MDQAPQSSDNASTLTLTLLGIGGAFDADQGVANTNALLQIKSGGNVVKRYLIDCGHTCGHQLHHMGLTYADIDGVFITHTHGDHIDGLEVAGYKNFFLHKHRCTLFSTPPVLERVWDSLAPKMAALQTAPHVMTLASLGTYFDLHPLGNVDGGTVVLCEGRLRIDFIPVRHVASMPSYALLLSFGEDTSQPTIRWSGDATFDADSPMFDNLSKERGDLIFHDCTFIPFYNATVHTHFTELATLPEHVRRHTVLVHHGKLSPSDEPDPLMRMGQPLQSFHWTF